MKLSITIQTPEIKRTVPVSLLSGTLEEKITKAGLMGVNGLELMTNFPEDLDASGINACISKKGIQISAISSGALAFTLGVTLLHADKEVSTTAIQRLHRLIEFASKVQSSVVTIGSFRGRLANTSNN
jgi:sugar phosphate isomerase/epimerase